MLYIRPSSYHCSTTILHWVKDPPTDPDTMQHYHNKTWYFCIKVQVALGIQCIIRIVPSLTLALPTRIKAILKLLSTANAFKNCSIPPTQSDRQSHLINQMIRNKPTNDYAYKLNAFQEIMTMQGMATMRWTTAMQRMMLQGMTMPQMPTQLLTKQWLNAYPPNAYAPNDYYALNDYAPNIYTINNYSMND